METRKISDCNPAVQPGWTYDRKQHKFIVPTDEIESIDSDRTFRINTYDSVSASYVYAKCCQRKNWEKDFKNTDYYDGVTLLVCTVHNTKFINSVLPDCEYASKVYYGYSLSFLVQYRRNANFNSKSLLDALASLWNTGNEYKYLEQLSMISQIIIYQDDTRRIMACSGSNIGRGLLKIINFLKTQPLHSYSCDLQNNLNTDSNFYLYENKKDKNIGKNVCSNLIHFLKDDSILKPKDAEKPTTGHELQSRKEPPPMHKRCSEPSFNINPKEPLPALHSLERHSEESRNYSVRKPTDKNDTPWFGTPSQEPQFTKKLPLQMENPSYVESIGKFNCNHFSTESSPSVTSEPKTLILIGSSGTGKSWFVNLFWNYCCQDRKNYLPIINTEEGRTHKVSMYKFLNVRDLSLDACFIDTPGLCDNSFEELKCVLKEEILGIHGICLVLDGRNTSLTSTERQMVNFIRSSFGEVINNHFLVILNHCREESNFTTLEEIDAIGVKPVINLVLRTHGPITDYESKHADKAISKANINKVKQCLATIQGMTRILMKTGKIIQEQSYIQTHLESSETEVTKLLSEFTKVLSQNGPLDSEISLARKIWNLFQFVMCVRDDQQTSENHLIDYAAIFTESKVLLNLILLDETRNLTTRIKTALELHQKLWDTYSVTGSGRGTIPLTETVTLYCSDCKEICQASRMGTNPLCKTVSFKCNTCHCDARQHSLWTYANNKELANDISGLARDSISQIMAGSNNLKLSKMNDRVFYPIISRIYPNLASVFLK